MHLTGKVVLLVAADQAKEVFLQLCALPHGEETR